ncbi:MAG: hypothetical protein ACJ748_08510 [Flavisolibacter sp.]
MRTRIVLLLIIISWMSCKKEVSQPPLSYKVKYEVVSSDVTSLIIVQFTKPDGKDSTASPGLIPPFVPVPWKYLNSFNVDPKSDPPKGKVGFTVLDNQAGILTERIYVNDKIVAQVTGSSITELNGVALRYELK